MISAIQLNANTAWLNSGRNRSMGSPLQQKVMDEPILLHSPCHFIHTFKSSELWLFPTLLSLFQPYLMRSKSRFEMVFCRSIQELHHHFGRLRMSRSVLRCRSGLCIASIDSPPKQLLWVELSSARYHGASRPPLHSPCFLP